MAVSISIEGLSELYQRLTPLESQDFLLPLVYRAVVRVHYTVAKYPPRPPESQYTRTGTLGRRWTTRVTRVTGGVQGTIGNNTLYGPYVQSNEHQAGIHRGRWITIEEAIQRNLILITRDFEFHIDQILRR